MNGKAELVTGQVLNINRNSGDTLDRYYYAS